LTNGDEGAKVEAPFLSTGVGKFLEKKDTGSILISLLEAVGEFLPVGFAGVTVGILLMV